MIFSIGKYYISDTILHKDSYKLMQIRKRYRKYFAGRKVTDLFRLVFYPKVSMRMKVHYIKEHWEYYKNR